VAAGAGRGRILRRGRVFREVRLAQRRFHYEQAFESYLCANRVPYVAVDEAKKALLPPGRGGGDALGAIKSFDFVVYTDAGNLLIDVKGRMYGSARSRSVTGGRRFESWVTTGDVEGLLQWQRLFGPGFRAVFVFLYCLRQQPPDALFEEILSHAGRWYVPREVLLDEYVRAMTPRSRRWKTVHVPAATFARISRPFTVRDRSGRVWGSACDAPRGDLC
jgi:hypothetical protein